MTAKRIAVWTFAVVAVGLGVAVVTSGAADFVLFLLYIGIHDTLFPETISWDAKNAFLKCPAAIADPRLWPPAPDAACNAMFMCVNEAAPLSDSQKKALRDRIRRTPGCQAP